MDRLLQAWVLPCTLQQFPLDRNVLSPNKLFVQYFAIRDRVYSLLHDVSPDFTVKNGLGTTISAISRAILSQT